jgi:hypothetical protein
VVSLHGTVLVVLLGVRFGAPGTLSGRKEMKIYLASSWRNEKYDSTRVFLEKLGNTVYDFKNEETAFEWKEIDPDFEMHGPLKTVNMSAERFVKALQHPFARLGYESDAHAIYTADLTVLLLPCGRSAHAEFGMAVGQGHVRKGKYTIVFLDDPISEPEIVYLGATAVVKNLDELKSAVALISLLVDSVKEEEHERELRRHADRGSGDEASG